MRLILLAILLYLLYRVLRSYLGKAKTPDRHQGGEINDMVQDPVCKTFIHVRDAEKRVIKGQTHYFCSKECAERFEIEQKGK